MGIQEKLRGRVAPYVNEGEQVQQVIPAQGGLSPWMVTAIGAILVAVFSKPRILVVTDKRIVVLRGSKISGAKPQEVLGELPRQTKLGPVKGKLWGKIDVGDESLYVHRRFHQAVAAADAAIA